MRMSDWSSDVCSSDLAGGDHAGGEVGAREVGAVEVAGAQVGTGEVGVGQHRVGEVDSAEVRAAQVDRRQHGTAQGLLTEIGLLSAAVLLQVETVLADGLGHVPIEIDRKSTRLNSSH